ncbi:MAG: glycosyltransferase family 9 protein, partial [Bdellovibrionaceae bacterium]|nr:glycosyltransferase family 9 protein [Pseudobdellovibrionaceae bacterium]
YCRKGLGEFFLRFGLVDHVIEVDKSNSVSRTEAAHGLRDQVWDWIICPHESFRTQMLVRSLRAKRKTGYRRFWNAMVFHERVRRPMRLPEALRQLALLRAADPIVEQAFASWASRAGEAADFQRFPELASLDSRVLGEVPDWASMTVPHLSEIHQTRSAPAPRKLSELCASIVAEMELNTRRGSGVVFLAPGSVWPTKMWTREGYTSSARELLKMGFRVVVMGAPAERELCEGIAAESGADSLAGRTSLSESAEILALADVLICNDSGAMHMAAACGVPSVAVFGPTTLELGYRPWQNAARVVQKSMTCRPCGKHGANACPLGTHECMRSISSSDVLQNVGDLLADKADRGVRF